MLFRLRRQRYFASANSAVSHPQIGLFRTYMFIIIGIAQSSHFLFKDEHNLFNSNNYLLKKALRFSFYFLLQFIKNMKMIMHSTIVQFLMRESEFKRIDNFKKNYIKLFCHSFNFCKAFRGVILFKS